jgi:hypothetical protein
VVALLITIVVCTFNGADTVERTLRGVLGQDTRGFEVVVVDDGSTDRTPEVLAGITDSRLRVVRQDNAGLGAARNTGLAHATGEWVVFLDDDDVPHPDWISTLTGPTADPEVGISCVGSRAVDPDGNELAPLPVVPLGQPFGDVVGSYRAGTFAVRTDLYRRAGGYLDGLGTSHQFELFIRLLTEARRSGLSVAATDRIVLDIERRPVDARLSSHPQIAYDATAWVLSRHEAAFAGQFGALAAFHGVAGTSAARFGDWRSARRHLWRAARLEPRKARTWGRALLTIAPRLGTWVWNHQRGVVYDSAKAGIRLQPPGHTSGEPELFLAWGYRPNPPVEGDALLDAPLPAPWLGRLSRRLSRRHPGLTVSLNAIEQDDDPVGLLQRLAKAPEANPVLLVTTDRSATDPHRPLGPPSDPRHRREWTLDQVVLLLRSTGFGVERWWARGTDLAVLARPLTQPLEVGG